MPLFLRRCNAARTMKKSTQRRPTMTDIAKLTRAYYQNLDEDSFSQAFKNMNKIADKIGKLKVDGDMGVAMKLGKLVS